MGVALYRRTVIVGPSQPIIPAGMRATGSGERCASTSDSSATSTRPDSSRSISRAGGAGISSIPLALPNPSISGAVFRYDTHPARTGSAWSSGAASCDGS